ncbi:MAG: DUF1223 domain-containing protein [Hyphomonadaceae bacterium]
MAAARSYGLKGLALRAGVMALALGLGAWRLPPTSPTVVEIFQSQGCSSCPPANENILALVDRPDLLVLSFGVTYWDKLGWKDTFASHANTQRQYDYAAGLKRRNVATPQVIIDGRIDITGLDRSELNRSIAAVKTPTSPPAISLSGDALILGAASAPATGADVWLVRYDPRIVQVPVKAGENTGRTLPHRNVVRELVRLGGWSGKAVTYRLPAASDPALRNAILVQAVSGGPIITALKP